MLSYSRNRRPWIISAFLLAIVILCFCSFALLFCSNVFPINYGTYNLPVQSGGSMGSTQVDSLLLLEGRPYRINDTVQTAKLLQTLRQSNTLLPVLQQGMFFAWLSIYAYIYFHKKTTKPSPILALPLGGHAPPFAQL